MVNENIINNILEEELKLEGCVIIYRLVYWFKLSRSALILECLLFGLKNRGLLIFLIPDVSPASAAGIF